MRPPAVSHLLALAVLQAACLGAPLQQAPTPEEHLGHPVGADFELPDWEVVSSYFRILGDRSPRVLTETVGETTEGRDFLVSVLSSEQNLARLDEIREGARLVADPRGVAPDRLQRIVDEEPVVLFITCAMHATECASPQFGMQFAHDLATEESEFWRRVRERVVVVLIPSLNPDGLDHVAEWYRDTKGTPFEASGLLKLYQYYAGHDNNRDWFMLTQAETRIMTELIYQRWHPQVYWDVHQQGSDRERFFVPPFRDPLNPNLDPAIIAAIDSLGSRALLDLTREGFSGVSTGVSYDMWWNGGNRNVPVRHNIIGLLTEAASAHLASPVFLPISKLSAPRGLGAYAASNRFPDPWPGGWWRIGDIVRYELAFGRSLLASLARESPLWLQNAADAARRAIDEGGKRVPRAWILPADNRDPGAVARLADVLIRTGVELSVADEEVTADDRTWPAGSIVIPRRQPYGTHVKDLFEVQRYPVGDPPYDVAGWTLPFLLGVHRVEAVEFPRGPLRRVETAAEATAAFHGDPRTEGRADALSLADSETWKRVFARLAAGEALSVGAGELDEGLILLGEAESEDTRTLSSLPRIGLYSPWRGSMDEGWTRYVFDSFGLNYTTVRNESLRAGALVSLLDVLVIPSLSSGQLDRGRAPGSVPPMYTRGLDPEGAVAIEEFVRGGGTLITIGDSSRWAIELFQLALVDVTRAEEGSEFSCPGSVLRAIPAIQTTCGPALPASLALFFSRSSAWRKMTAEEREESGREEEPELDVLLRYAPSRLLLSGWIEEPQVIEGRAAWVRATHGAGRVHLFAFRPQYRGWAQATFPLLFRAILFGGAPDSER